MATRVSPCPSQASQRPPATLKEKRLGPQPRMRDSGVSANRRRNEFAHAAAITILTPKGVISNYLAGHRYPTRDVRLALFEASDGKVGNLFDFFLAYCYIYDENEKKYVVFARNVMKIAGGITLVVLTAIILLFFALERRRRQRLLKQPQPA